MAGYIPLMCRHLEAVAVGRIRNLLANYPPAMLKSSLVAVAYPAYCWTLDNRRSFIVSSYAEAKAAQLSRECRQLVESDWYRMLWPHVQIAADQNSKVDFRLDNGAFYKAVSTTGITGEHPTDIIWDDPLDAKHRNNRLKKKEFRDVYQGVTSTRGVTRNVRKILVQQRLAVDDPSSVALEENENARRMGAAEPWHHFLLPMHFNPKWAMLDRGYGGDWRKKPGELIDPERLPHDKVREMESAMGAADAAAQLEQDPRETADSIFDMDFYKEIDIADVPKDLDEVCRFWDTAGTDGAGCETAGVLIGRKDRVNRFTEKVSDYYILHVHAGKWDIDKVDDEIEGIKEQDLVFWGYDRLWTAMEEGFGGKHAVRDIGKRLSDVKFSGVPTGGKNKAERAIPLARCMRRGNLYVVIASWTAAFKAQLKRFPNGDLIDQIDAAAGGHLVLEGTLGKPKKKKKAVMAGVGKLRTCSAHGCGRPCEADKEFCCEQCEQISAFEDPSMQVDHDAACCQRFFEYQQR